MTASYVEAPVFAAPWEAQVFALVVALQDAGVIGVEEWAETLGAAIRSDPKQEVSADYERWLGALGTLLARKDILSADDVDGRRDAFLRAAHATPHGHAILLENDPFFQPREG